MSLCMECIFFVLIFPEEKLGPGEKSMSYRPAGNKTRMPRITRIHHLKIPQRFLSETFRPQREKIHELPRITLIGNIYRYPVPMIIGTIQVLSTINV